MLWRDETKNTRAWGDLGWLIVRSRVEIPGLLLCEGCPPCAILPYWCDGASREFLLTGMMIALAERYPHLPNPYVVLDEREVRHWDEGWEEHHEAAEEAR